MQTQSTLLWIRSLLSFSLLVQSLEMLTLSRSITFEHPWHWKNVSPSFESGFIFFNRSFRFIFEQNFTQLIFIQILMTLALPLVASPVLIFGLFITALLINIRFGGVFNGGSDYMTMVTLAGLLSSSLILENNNPSKWGLLYIGIQCILSYFIAGLVKIKNPTWRNGQALKIFMTNTNYAVPPKVRQLAHSNVFLISASWIVMAWECMFPICWLWPKATPFFLGLAFLFHLGNFFCFGINRFVFAWLATYPAVLYCTNFI